MVTLEEAGVLVVLRGHDFDTVRRLSDQCVAAGIRVLEVTFTIPQAEKLIYDLHERHPTTLIGAGTVTTKHQAKAAVDAGAAFLVSPVNPDFFLPFAHHHEVLGIPGASTPTEIWRAMSAGASVVKIFPIAELGGVDYLRDLFGPFPDLRCMVSGRVHAEEVAAYRNAGAWCVALGATVTDAEESARSRLLATALQQVQS